MTGYMAHTKLTPKIIAYCLSEEAVILEAYKDSKGVWTWAGGVTNKSGHQVYPRYLDNPQTLQYALEVTIWLMRNTYLPDVLKRFKDRPLTEAQLAAAMSFQWNTGAILKAFWAADAAQGLREREGRDLYQYSGKGLLAARRKREHDLFYRGIWPNSLRVPVFPVKKPSYTPDWDKGQVMNMLPMITSILEREGE